MARAAQSPEAKNNYVQIRAFAGPDGSSPQAPLFRAGDGFLYGTTANGGTHGKGAAYRTSRSGKFKLLHSFTGIDGEQPYGQLMQASDGDFYGTTLSGGLGNGGVVYKMTPQGAITVMHHFGVTTGDGREPRSGLIQATDGKFYGTTRFGGQSDLGTVYQMDINGTLVILWSLGTTAGEGKQPFASLIQASDGLLYGMSAAGGTFDVGTVFSLTPDTFTPATLRHFNVADGADPRAALLQASDGQLYGTTSAGGSFGLGTAFRMTLGGSLTVLHSFGGTSADARNPDMPLIEPAPGKFFGTSPYGGKHGLGTVFRMQANGKVSIRQAFSGSLVGNYVDGANGTGLVLTEQGELFGATSQGGVHGVGSLYRLDAK